MSDKSKILIVEDQLIVAKDIAATLKAAGYEISGISVDAKNAIKMAETYRPDLVLMDIRLKGEMTGIDAAKVIYPRYNIPIVYLTAHSDTETLNKAKITEPFGYVLKPYDAKILNTAVEMALYKHKMEVELKNRTRELEEEKIVTDKLLHNILPNEIVGELKETGSVAPKRYDNISIMFTDFQGFAEILPTLSPKHMIKELNDIFNSFDSIIEQYGLEKLKTIGDSYMIASGLPKESSDHAIRIIEAALKMNDFIEERNKNSKIKWKMKTGINSGSVIAGVVGSKKFTFDIWGDAVNIAARMESSCTAGRINISESTYKLVKDKIKVEYYGKLKAKVKDEIEMYFVCENQ